MITLIVNCTTSPGAYGPGVAVVFITFVNAKSNTCPTGTTAGSWSSPPIVSAVSLSFDTSSGVASSPGVLSISVASAPPSTSLPPVISASLIKLVPMKLAAIVDCTPIVTDVPAPIKSIVKSPGAFCEAPTPAPPNNTGRLKPNGASSITSTSKASTVP